MYWGIGIMVGLILNSSIQRMRPNLSVAVCDMAGIRVDIWRAAKAATLRIFNRAGVQMNWSDTNEKCVTASMNIHFVVVITAEPLNGLEFAQADMGFAPHGGAGGYHRVYVWYEHVKTFVAMYSPAPEDNSEVGLILGHVIAHELGHVLIPERAHSDQGLMRRRWGLNQRQEAHFGSLLFHPDHARLIRRELGEQ